MLQIGFTVDRTLKDGINPYPHDVESTCAIAPRQSLDESSSSILFALDFETNRYAKLNQMAYCIIRFISLHISNIDSKIFFCNNNF